jgi:hypothetical protein
MLIAMPDIVEILSASLLLELEPAVLLAELEANSVEFVCAMVSASSAVVIEFQPQFQSNSAK